MKKIELSLSTLASECALSRETVGRALDLAGVKPSGERRGHPVYRLRDCLPALATYLRPDGDDNPDGLPPHQQHSHWKAKLVELQVRKLSGELCYRAEAEQLFVDEAKLVAHLCGTLPDILERDCGLPGHAIARAERLVDEFRRELMRRIDAFHAQRQAGANSDSPQRSEGGATP